VLAGNPEGWLGHFQSLEKRLTKAIEDSWPGCLAPLVASTTKPNHEDPITDQIVAALILSKNVPGRFSPQHALLTIQADGTHKISSKIDFVLTIGDDESTYLACECKRLNVVYPKRTVSLANKYINDGLKRFTNEQYSPGLPLAMMLGYVMDSRLTLAMEKLGVTINNQSASINFRAMLQFSISGAKSLRFTTTHGFASGSEIVVCHTLLAWP